jgi:anti-sigma factor (TIGR02949 family)
MTKVQFGDDDCEKIRNQLDSYSNNELGLEPNQAILRHLENCSACSAELTVRTRLRAQLKAAVERQYVPQDLQRRVRQRIWDRESRARFGVGSNRWALAIAASLAICFGVWVNYSRQYLPALSDRPGQDAYIQEVSATLAPILKIGLADHIHCSVFRKYSRTPPAAAQMERELGPSYKGLLRLVKAAVPDEYRVIMAHQCGYAGRKYIHLTLRNGSALLSVVITRKNAGESLNGLASAASASGIPVYESSAAKGYRVAAFDAGPYLAFVVSDLRGKANLQIASNLVPTAHEFLARTPA